MPDIREFRDSDLDFMNEHNPLSALELQFHGDVDRTYSCAIDDEEGNIAGVLYLKRHNSFGAEGMLNRVIPVIVAAEGDMRTYAALLERAKLWLARLKKERESACLTVWVQEDERELINTYLRAGFIEELPCPCLAYDLSTELAEPNLPDGLRIDVLSIEPEDVDRYIASSREANDGLADSANELYFVSHAEGFEAFVVRDKNNRVLSTASVWHIAEGRGAVENVFTVPDARRRGLARAVITHALRRQKANGYAIATLGTSGDNRRALRLYCSMGFKLIFNQIRMAYI